MRKALLHTILFLVFLAGMVVATPLEAAAGANADTTPMSTQAQAIALLDKLGTIQQSPHWPNVHPAAFMQNLRKDVEQPFSIYEGRSTNFCGYAALSFLPLHYDPLGFVGFMVKMYQEGKAVYGKAYFEPSKEVKRGAGRLVFKGELDIRPADQMWFMVLADHFKGYLNIFDPHYNPGDENRLWAAVNLAKFCRMIRTLFNYNVSAVGSDLFRPGVRDMYEYLSERLKTGHLALFVNNPGLYRKDHHKLKVGVPTHYIILLNVEEMGDRIACTYWDYGGRTMQLLSPDILKRIVFGIIHITRKSADAQ
ncbi:MAG: hypothetical protein JO301_15935 [Chitinophagaceae bacterium]|nr:hypothetical protein [Chitinophagaceae bacterium]